MDIETRLLHKVIADRTIVKALERGIEDSWILDEDNRAVWSFLRNHYGNYREVPSEDAVKDNFPSFRLQEVEDSLEYLIDKVIEDHRKGLARIGLQNAIEQFEKDDYELAVQELSRTVFDVNTAGSVGTNHVDLTKNIDARLEDYERLNNLELLGVPTGFSKIDEATAGLQGGQLITVIAPPKTGKSQIALRMAINTHELGKVPMFQSFEMSNFEQSQRHDAMRANLSHTLLRRGALDDISMERYKDMLEDLKNQKPFHMVDAINGLTVDALVAKAEQLNPDILFVDGVYLMFDHVTGEANTPQALTNITRGLKRVAQSMDIPIVITTQTLLWKMKGKKVSAESIGYSSSFFQDSDVILGLQPAEDEEDSLRVLKIVQARNAPPDTEVFLTWNWETSCFHEEDPDCKWCEVPWGGGIV